MTRQTISHCRILEKLGGGAMGVVYEAEDLKLKRFVALKFLPQEFSKDPHALERFQREAEAASALNHPNICTIHDIDEAEGQHFIAMEFLEGETLKHRLLRKRLDTEEILDLGIQIASGLDAAHSKGILHRDVKPANIFLTRTSQAKLLDFGLAKLLTERRPLPRGAAAGDVSTETEAELLTSPGTAVGTVAYMSPEQAFGKELDSRTDLFSLGVVLYETATGMRPFLGDTSAALIDQILHKTPTAPGRLNPDLPAELEHIINKALEKDRGLRYQSAKDLQADLRRLSAPAPRVVAPKWRAFSRRAMLTLVAALAAILLVVGLNVGGLRYRLFGRIGTPHIESLAVLPLENLSGDPNQEFFTNGMTEALIAELSKIKGLNKVISRTSVMQYKGTRKPIPQIAKELGVDALIEGSAFKEGDVVRITVQLIHGATDAHLWANSFDREYKNILALHQDVARAIAQEVKVALTPEELVSLTKAPVVRPEAYECYLQGNDHRLRTELETDTRIAVERYEKAIELDPSLAPAYAALSEAHALMWWMYYDHSNGRVAKAKAVAERALQLQPELPETHRALGYYYYYWCRLDYDRALEEFAIAQKGKPNDSLIPAGIAYVLRRQGKMERSLANLKKAAALDPLSANIAHNAGETCVLSRDHIEADRYLDLAIKLAPDWPEPYAIKALCDLRLAGDTESSQAVIERAERVGLANATRIIHSRVLLDLYEGNFQEALTRLSSGSWEALELQFYFVPKALLQGQIHSLMNQPQLARNDYESATKMAEARVRQQPDEALFHSSLGIAYAGLGRTQDAIREGKAGVDLLPITKDAYRGLYRVEELARIYVMVGDYEAAIGRLEYLMSIPGDLGVGALRLDPAWKPLRNHPRFQSLLRRYGG